MRARFAVPLILAVVSAAVPAVALPPMGAFSIDVGGDYSSLKTRDIEDLYAPLTLDNHASAPVAFQGGVLYNVTDAFQLGLGVEDVMKRYEVTWPNGDKETWKADALGIVGRVRWLIPGSSPSILYAIGATVGQYKLSSASVTANYTTAHGDLDGTATGGAITVGGEYSFGGAVSIGLDLGYRMAKIRSVTETIRPGDLKADLLNGDGSKAMFDYTGPFVALALRFTIGGDGSSVTSQ